MVTRTEEMAVSVFGHPFGAGEMSGMNLGCSTGLGCGVKSEQKFDHFFPSRTFRLGVEQPEVQFEMRLIVGGERRPERRFVQIFCVGHDEPHESFVSNLERFVNRNDIPCHTAAV